MIRTSELRHARRSAPRHISPCLSHIGRLFPAHCTKLGIKSESRLLITKKCASNLILTASSSRNPQKSSA